jgi:hypothetical protein
MSSSDQADRLAKAIAVRVQQAASDPVERLRLRRLGLKDWILDHRNTVDPVEMAADAAHYLLDGCAIEDCRFVLAGLFGFLEGRGRRAPDKAALIALKGILGPPCEKSQLEAWFRVTFSTS